MVFYCVLLFYLNKKRKISIFSVTVYFLKHEQNQYLLMLRKTRKTTLE